MKTQPRGKMRENSRRWRKNNPEKAREINRRSYLNNREKTREKMRENNRRWHLNNPEKARSRARRWRENNPDKSLASTRRWRANNPEKARESRLKAKYGITLADFEALNRRQNGLCNICHKTCSKHKVLSVDHCHKTGRVRGLLCNRCNRGLSVFNEDFSALIRAANHIGWK